METNQITSKSDAIEAQLAKPMTPLSHKDMAAHIRGRIKQAGIKARVQMDDFCGVLWIKVIGVTFESQFSEDEQRTIRQIAKVNGLTWAQGMEIKIEQMTDAKGFHFVFHGSKHVR